MRLPTPRIPSTTITATTIKTIFRALLLCAGVAGAGGAAGVAAEPTTAAGTAAPHLGQNRAPGPIFVPQELQKAIDHLAWFVVIHKGPTAEYIANVLATAAAISSGGACRNQPY